MTDDALNHSTHCWHNCSPAHEESAGNV